MLYSLRIGKSRFTSKTIAECCDIIAARAERINAESLTAAAWILFEIANLPGDVLRLAYYGKNGKVFISINRR